MIFLTSNLAIGNSTDGRNERKLLKERITASINVASDLSQPIYDRILGRKMGLGAGGDGLNEFAEAVNLVDAIMQTHVRTIIYCHNGFYRSAFVAAAVLCRQNGWTPEESVDFVRNKMSSKEVPSKSKAAKFYTLLKNWWAHDEIKKPSVSIIVPAYHHFISVARCIESIRKNTSYPSYELIAIDDGYSEPKVNDFLADTCDRLISHDAPLGMPQSRVEASQAAKGDIICQIDSDSVFFPQWLTRLVEIFQSHGHLNVRVVSAMPSNQIEHFALSPMTRIGECFLTNEITTTCMMYSRRWSETIKNFTERFEISKFHNTHIFSTADLDDELLVVAPQIIIYQK